MIKTLYDPRIKAEGKKEGIEIGKMEGKMEIAIRMLDMDMNIEQIAKATDLSIAEIEKLASSEIL